MPYYILVTLEQEVEITTTPEMLAIKEIQELMGSETLPANCQIVAELSFSDSSIVMVCDADAVSTELPPTCVTKNGDVVCGQVVILATHESPNNLCLLNVRQAKIVKAELKLYPKPVKPEHNFSASLWDID
ncbi:MULTISPECIES: hypothetical protein [unclassified Microcoleus]|uniref:hypothetical protein n=1 Tax=unclassified Microcoleus TaxID=2642155 RepID=UPI002FCFC10D